jgi:hypothetical protein
MACARKLLGNLRALIPRSAPQERVSLGCFRMLRNDLEHPSETPLLGSSG